MSVQSSYLNKKGLTVKDLVTIGIFTALFFVFELIGSLPFGPAVVFLAYFADPAAWAETMLNNGTSQEYIDMMTASAPVGMLPVILLGTIILGIISGLVGKKLLKKQFEKAGITA